MKIGLIREGKIPTDSRVPLPPSECVNAMKNFPVEIVVQSSGIRCFENEEYENKGIKIVSDVEDCDILMGVKEVPVNLLIPGKTYFIFSHTIKKQAYNRKLLSAILEKNIRLIDYEVLKNEYGIRLIAFGRFAGMVGVHNALWTYGKRTGSFSFKRMHEFREYAEAREFYRTIKLPAIKIVLTGSGRVSTGAVEVLHDMGITRVAPEDFISGTFPYPVFTQLDCNNYVARKDGRPFEKLEFYQQPELFENIFSPYCRVADVMIHGIYWDNHAPVFFTLNEMQQPDFKIKVIADITCDIAPVSSVPSTLRPSTIADPVYGFDPVTNREIQPFQSHGIDIMAIDNLPSELPRDASTAFGKQFVEHILPELFKEKSEMIEKATIAKDGQLTKHFQYLEDYVASYIEENSTII
jgi:saccharopine dehydrogenase (NAD+, L-lysine forming)